MEYKIINFNQKNGTKTTGLKFSDELVELTVKGILNGEDLQFKYHDGSEVIMLLLKEKFQLLTGLPVRELPNIMTVSQKRKRMPPMDVGLQQQAHGMHPQLNMVIVSKYELVEKSPGVFC